MASIPGMPAFGRCSIRIIRSSTSIPARPSPFRASSRSRSGSKTLSNAEGLRGVVKTSGSRGIHIYIPLPPRTSEATALAVAQHIATRVADAHPRETTIRRGLRDRGTDTVYLDYLQNARGKTVAAAYCVRAVEDARVSTPLEWAELTPKLDPHAFTLRTVPDRVAHRGDLWSPAMAKRNPAAAIKEMLGA